MPSHVKRVRAISENKYNQKQRAYMTKPIRLAEKDCDAAQETVNLNRLARSTRPGRRSIKEIQKYIYLRKAEGQQVELAALEAESLAWYREMRLQEEAWLAQHIPIRDAVFEDHETSSARAGSSSARASKA